MPRKVHDTYLGYYDGPAIPVTKECERTLDHIISASAKLRDAIKRAGLSA